MNLDERVINYDNYDDFKIKVINNELKKIMKKLDKRKGKIHKECIGELDRDQSYEDLLYQYNRLLAEKIVDLFRESRLKFILTEDDYKNLILHEREDSIIKGLSIINERYQEV